MKGQLEELGEPIDENVENISKMQGQILNMTKGKVNIFDDAGDFKSTYEIMDGIASVWNDLSSIDQAELLETIAGKHRANDVAALLSNWENVRAAVISATEAEGSASAENAKYIDSIQGRLDKLTTSWQSLSNTFMSSDFLKGAISGLTNFVEIFEGIIDRFGTLPTLIGGIAAGLSLYNGTGIISFDKETESLKLFGNAIGNVERQLNNMGINSNAEFRKSFDADIAALRNYGKVIDSGISATDAFNACMSKASVEAQEYAKANQINNKTILEFGKQQKAAQVTMTAQNKSWASVTAIMKEYNSGCKNTAMTQKDFISAVGAGNSGLGSYLTKLNGAKAGMAGYVSSLIGAKAATIGLQVATMALNTALTMGIAAAISFVISKLDEWIVTADELAEKVDEVTSKYKESRQELGKMKNAYDTSNEDSMISRYGELSKGVNALGENVALTADEYAEYQSIVETVASQIPGLVTGYNSQGDAILSCAGDVNTLAEAYKNLIIQQNKAVLDSGEDIFKDFKNNVSSISGMAGVSSTRHLDELNVALENFNERRLELIDGETYLANLDEWADNLAPNDVNNIVELLEDNGFKQNTLFDGIAGSESKINFIQRTIKEDSQAVIEAIKGAYNDINAFAEEPKLFTDAYLGTEFLTDYAHMSERMQGAISQVTSSFDTNFFEQFIEGSEFNVDRYEKFLDGTLAAFDNLDEIEKTQFEAAFDLKTQFNGGKISLGEYVNGLQDAAHLIDGMDLAPEIKSQIKLSLGLSENSIEKGKWVVEEYESTLNRLTSEKYEIQLSDDEAKALLNDLTASEYDVLAKLVLDGKVDLSNFDINSLRAYIEKEAKISDALNFSPNIEVDTAYLEAFNTAIAESASAIGLSSTAIDSLKSKYSDLEGYNPATLFESTANGVKVNRQEVNKLEKEYQNLKKAEVQEHIDSLTEAYNENVAMIDKCVNASERLELLRENESYKSQIEELATYQAQLEGVTGAYQRWIDAQATPESYEGYEAVAQGREAIEDELKRGFLGNATKEYIDLLSGKDLIGGTIDDYYAAWKDLNNKIGSTSYSIHDLFTVDTDGNVTATGVHRFFEGVQKDFKDSVAKFNEETGKWTYDFSQENLQKIQDEWGFGIEAIGLMLEAASAAGYDVDFGGILDNIDLDTSNFETLIEVAEEAQEAFNKLEGVDNVHFNFSATGIEEATSEIEKAREAYIDLITDEDGNVDLSVTGAEEMRFMLSTLIVQKQQLEDSNIVLSIDTSQLDESQAEIGAAIDAVIQFRESYKNLEIAVETGEGIEEAKTELSAAMTELQGLGDEGVDIAAQLILGEGADASTLQSEIDAAVAEIGKPDITVGCKLDETSIGNLNSQLLTNFTPEATVKITKIDDTLVAGYTSTEKTANGTVVWTNDDKLVKQFINSKHEASGSVKWKNNSKNLTLSGWKATGTVTWTSGNNVQVKVVKLAKGTAYMSGAAHASGSTGLSGRAFAQGNWGIKNNGVALGGEIGREVVVRDGKFFTIGDNGAEFFKYKKNDIVFNATQTEALFKYGGIKGANPRGKMLASGSAFASGNYPSDGSAFAWTSNVTGGSNFANDSKNNTVSTSTSNKTSSNKTDSSSKKTEEAAEKTKEAAEEFKESVDLIEIAINRLERTISQLDTRANSAYRSWEERNSALVEQIGKVGEEIALQQKAYERYMQEAANVGLDAEWVLKIQNGSIDIEEITDEELKEKIDEYRNWYEAALDCKDAIIELQEAESELYKQRFDNVLAQYEGMLSIIEHEKNMLDEFVAQSEAQGWLISEKYYEALIGNEQKQIAKLEEEKTALLAELQTAMQSGKIAKGSEAW